MGYFEDFYKKILPTSKKDSTYNAKAEGGDMFKISGYDPAGHFAEIQAVGGQGRVYHNNGNFYLRVRPQ